MYDHPFILGLGMISLSWYDTTQLIIIDLVDHYVVI